MASVPDPAKSVVLSLTVDGPSSAHVEILERRIILYPGHLDISIGRASKVSRKGFTAANDNGWFDSPVMSRLHARLSATMEEKKIQIRDLGSLHGTFVNDKKCVPKDESYEVKDGDLLRFGAPIWRGTEQFLPTTVRVGVQFPNRDGTFQVPDGSDDEGTDDGQHKVIDLTTTRETRAVIDLSTPSGSPGHASSNNPFFQFAGSRMGSLDITPESYRTGSSTGHLMGPQAPIDVPGGGIAAPPTWPTLQVEDRWSGDTDDDDESEISVDYESEVGSSEDEHESNLETDEEENDFSSQVDDEDLDRAAEDDLGIENTSSMDAEPARLDRDDLWGRAPSRQASDAFPEIMPLIESLSTPPDPLPSLRQPLVGWALDGGQQQSNSFPHPILTGSPPSMELAGSLGARTGKTDFFLAREDNKARLEIHKSTQARPISVQDLCNQDDSVDGPSHYSFGPAEQAIVPEEEDAGDIPSLEPGLSAISAAPVLPQTTPNEDIRSLKRKADDISETTPEQEEWAAAEETRVALKSSLTKNQEAIESAGDSPKAAVPCSDPPATKKRMLNVAERLGYAALGGVTAGAMIVGTLIYTAPTFA